MDHDVIDAAIAASLHADFSWGANNCFTFVFDPIAKATGRDPMASLRGRYHDEESAQIILDEAGGFVELVLALVKASGFKSVPFPFAGADFGIVTSRQGPALALFHNDRWVGRAKTGVVRVPLERGVMAWKVI